MFKKILLAVDINDPTGAGHVAEAAVRFAEADNAQLHIVNVVPDAGMALVGSYLGPNHAARMMKEASAALETWAAGAIPERLGRELHIAQGTIYDQIIKTADMVGADVIVVGSHRPELKDYLVGPNAARVVRHAGQSVLVIR